MRPHAPRTAVLIALLQALGVPALRAETVGCTPVTSLPATIADPVIYCLTGNLATSMTLGNAAIEIAASNVVLDLNGWILDGAAAGPDTQALGRPRSRAAWHGFYEACGRRRPWMSVCTAWASTA